MGGGRGERIPREKGNPDERNVLSKGMQAGIQQAILMGEGGSFEWTREEWAVRL